MHKASSAQETVLHELMQSSFGTNSLYRTPVMRENRSQDEPCDLLWYAAGTAVLFFMTSGLQKLEKQEDHNLKQAEKQLHHWRTSKKSFKAVNRFGDEVIVNLADCQRIAVISVVSHDCGIVFHKLAGHQLAFCCTLPERLIHTIAQIRGTIVDLLEIIENYCRHLTRHFLAHSPHGTDRVRSTLNEWAAHIGLPLRMGNLKPTTQREDLEFIERILGAARFLNVGATEGDNAIRSNMANYFGDMSSRDLRVLATACAEAVGKTENQKYTFAVYTQNLHLNWRIFATSLMAGNMNKFMSEFFDRDKDTPRNDWPLIIFAYGFEGADPRGPFAFALMPKSRFDRAELVLDRIAARLHEIFIRRSVDNRISLRKRRQLGKVCKTPC